MHVADRHVALHRRAVVERGFGVVDQLVVQRFIQAVILRDQAAPADAPRHLRIVQN